MPATEFAGVLIRARTGDADAFAWLFRRTQPLLLRYLNVLGGADASEDIASETWVSVVRDLGSFEGDEDAFRAWLVTVARHRLIDLRRAQVRRPAVPTEVLPEGGRTTPDAADEVIDREGTEWALSLIATLPRDQAEAVLLRVVVGLDAGATGQVMGRTSGAVRVLTHRGLRTLQERLGASSRAEV
jgi:RNA polymerase sigma-70 factor (ECF subfamily)